MNSHKPVCSCAKSFEDLENIDELRRTTESHFSQFKNIRTKVEGESQRVNKVFKKRVEELRQIKYEVSFQEEKNL